MNIENWRTIFTDLKKNDFHVIVECENLNNPTFTIGPIVKINKKSVEIMYYDATGFLDDKPTKLKFKDITLAKFGTRYLKIFRKNDCPELRR